MAMSQRALQPILRLPSQLHKTLTESGKLLPSPHQEVVLPALDNLTLSLPSHSTALRQHEHHVNHLTRLRRTAEAQVTPIHALRKLLHGLSPSRDVRTLPNSFFNIPDVPDGPAPPRGLYLHGDVGSGKSLLMELLFACAPLPAARLHFHPFMRMVYERVHHYDTLTPEQRHVRGWRHGLDAALEQLPAGLLAFDELQINDVADARLMQGVFERLLRRGTVICFTANRRPEDINRSQMGPDEFEAFLELLHDSCDVVNVDGVDYRGLLADDAVQCYFGRRERARLEAAWRHVTGCDWDDVVTADWYVGYGRRMFVQRVCSGKAVQMTVEELLESAMSWVDYNCICEHVEYIFISDYIPMFNNDNRDVLRRFINLVDVCYEKKVRLVMCMEADLDHLFNDVDATLDVALAEGLQHESEIGQAGVGGANRAFGKGNLYTGEDERFAFRRTISRLREMNSQAFTSIIQEHLR